MQTKIKTLKSPADFTSELSLSELSTQMIVLKYLQDNLLDYQRNFVKSYFKTIDLILNELPNDQYENYLSEFLEYKKEFNLETASNKYKELCEYWLIDYKNKKLIPFGNKSLSEYKFQTNKEATKLTMYFQTHYVSYHRGFASQGHLSKNIQIVKFQFNLLTNEFIGFYQDTIYGETNIVGFWCESTQDSYMTQANLKLWKNYVKPKYQGNIILHDPYKNK